MSALPSRITTSRLVVRPWRPEDEPLYVEAVSGSLEHLRPWLPWARVSVGELWGELAAFLARPESSHDLVYGIFDPDETKVLGSLGAHRRNADDDLEIGYWLRADATGSGYMSEAVEALTDAIFRATRVRTVTVVCDPLNERSAAVPERLGFTRLGIFPTKVFTPERAEDLIWRTTRGAWLRRARSPIA